MAKQTVNIGTAANDGTGDVPRTTGQKINANFDELYAADAVLTAAVAGKANTSHTQAASSISDSTTAGRALLTAADASAQKTALGLGTSAVIDVGTSANQVVQLTAAAKLPAVDGSLLTFGSLPTSDPGVFGYPWLNNGVLTVSFGAVAAPVFGSLIELFATSKSITLTSATSGASIYYTTNGSTPTSGSTLYSGAFTVSSTTTVKAIGIKAGFSDSTVTTQVYTKMSDLFGGSDNGFFIDATSTANLKANSDGTGSVTSNGDPVGRATDLSGKGLHLTQATAGARPTYQDGALRFDGTSQYIFTVSGPVATPAVTMVIVGKSRESGTGTKPIGGRGTYFDFFDIDGTLNFLSSGSTTVVNMGRAIRDRQHVMTLRRTSDTVAELRYDGVKVGADFNPSEASATDFFVLGADTVFASFFSACDISKAMLINRTLTDNEITKVEDYLLDEIEGSQAYDILLVAGQSNTYYGTGYNAGIDVTNASVDEFLQNQSIALAADPLDSFVGRNTGYIGPVMKFARDYVADGRLSGARKLLIVHCGYGGTGFDGTSPTTWADTAGSLREQTIRRAQAAVGLHVDNAVIGMIWVQGENDQAAGGSYMTNYGANLVDLFSDFRTQIPTASDMPIVVGSMTGSSVAATNGAAINAVHAAIGTNSSPAVYVNNTDLGLADLHFTAAEQRTIGSRMFTAWEGIA